MSASRVLPESLLRFYVKYAVRGHWAILIIWALTQFWLNTSIVLAPMMQRWFVELFENHVPAGTEFISYALPTVLLLLGLEVSFTLGRIFGDMLGSRWQPIISNQISEKLTDYVQTQSMSFWSGRMAGKISAQINYVADGFLLVKDFVRVAILFAMMALDVVLITRVDFYVAVLFGAMFAFRMIYGVAMLGPMHRASKQASESASSLSGKLIDSLSNFSIVKLFAAAGAEKKYLHAARHRQIKDRIHSLYIQRLFYAVPGLVWDLSYGMMLFLCVWLYSRGGMEISEIVFTMSVYFHVMMAIAQVIDVLPNIVDKLGSAKKSYDELNVPLTVRDMDGAPDLKVPHGKIEFRHVWFKYNRRWILRDFSLTINPGESVGLVGASGAGKTTLVNLLMRFYDPTSGQILIDGQDIKTVSQDSLRRNIAFIPQEPTMFNRSLRENIAYGHAAATDEQIRTAARRASADAFIMRADRGYDTLVGDRGMKLSGGQRQRIAIARAFLKNAPILVLDEATSALDSETEVAIQQSFEELAKNRTTIAIAHRLSTLRGMTRVVVMRHGRIQEMGPHRVLVRRGGEYARLWKMQSGGFVNG